MNVAAWIGSVLLALALVARLAERRRLSIACCIGAIWFCAAALVI
jgi:hypothetical protein